MNKQIKLCYAIRAASYIRHLFPEELPESFIRKLFPSELPSDGTERNESSFFEFCDKMIPYENFLETETSLGEIAGWKDSSRHYAFGHPRVEFHQQFANILIDKLETIYD